MWMGRSPDLYGDAFNLDLLFRVTYALFAGPVLSKLHKKWIGYTIVRVRVPKLGLVLRRKIVR